MFSLQIGLVTFFMLGNITITDAGSFNINSTKVNEVCNRKNHCQNGGSCHSVGEEALSWICTCADDWTGSRCNINRGCVDPSVCGNGGSCIGVGYVDFPNDTYYCQCLDGWSGRNCNEKHICMEKDFCRNGGTCTDAGRSGRMWKCFCPDGWYGERCERRMRIAWNNSNICNNGGTLTPNGTCICPDGWSERRCNEFIGNERTDFIVLMPSQHGVSSTFFLLLATNISTTVKIIQPGESIKNQQVWTFKSVMVIPYPLTQSHKKVGYKALRIHSTKPIYVAMHDEDTFDSKDITQIFPIEKLSTTYLVISANPTLLSINRIVDVDKWKETSFEDHVGVFVLSEVVIVAVHDNTSIFITLPPHLRHDAYDYIGKIRGQTTINNTTFEIKLSSLETFQIFHFLDFSGTRIHSSKPIAVFSGILCRPSYRCNRNIKQMPPVDQFDVTFIVPPNGDKSKSLIRVLSEENTTLVVSSPEKTETVSISAGEPHDIEKFGKEVLVIQSKSQCESPRCRRSSPLLVNMVSFSENKYTRSRLHMTLVPGIHQYQFYYKIIIPAEWEENYISIIIQESAASSLRMNQRRINSMDRTLPKGIDVEGVKYVVIEVKVPWGVMTFQSENAPFGLIAYGFDRYIDGYSFAGNVLFH